MLGDLSGAVLSCSTPVTVTRFSAPQIVKGRKVGKPVQETFSILASVQPAGQQQLRRLPEGTRTEGAVVVFAVERLRTENIETGEQADHILSNGVDYQVETVDDWFDLGGFYEIMATRVDR